MLTTFNVSKKTPVLVAVSNQPGKFNPSEFACEVWDSMPHTNKNRNPLLASCTASYKTSDYSSDISQNA